MGLRGALALLASLAAGCRDYGYALGDPVGAFIDMGIPEGGLPDSGGFEAESEAESEGECDGGDVFDVEYRGLTAIPPALTIPVGSTVRWTNNDPTPHTVTEGDPGNASPAFRVITPFNGGSAVIDFCEPASYRYFCETHPATMLGYTIDVTP